MEARPCLPGFIKRAVMNPWAGAVPALRTPDRGWFKGKPLIRTDSFQMELNLSTFRSPIPTEPSFPHLDHSLPDLWKTQQPDR